MTKKPQLKPIGAITGIGGRKEVCQYLDQQFDVIGFKPYNDGVPAFAKYQGLIKGYEMVCTFSVLKRTKYRGIDLDHHVRYRTFQGIRLKIVLPFKQKTRLVIANKITHKWLRRITNLALKYRKFKVIDLNYLDKEVYATDKLFAQACTSDDTIKHILQQLTSKQSQCLSWGLTLIPDQLTFGTTFANLDDFDTEKLTNRLENITNLAKTIENKPISQEMSLRKAEIIARDNPKKILMRGFWKILLFIIIGMLPIGLLFSVTLKFGFGYTIVMVVATYLIYKFI